MRYPHSHAVHPGPAPNAVRMRWASSRPAFWLARGPAFARQATFRPEARAGLEVRLRPRKGAGRQHTRRTLSTKGARERTRDLFLGRRASSGCLRATETRERREGPCESPLNGSLNGAPVGAPPLGTRSHTRNPGQWTRAYRVFNPHVSATWNALQPHAPSNHTSSPLQADIADSARAVLIIRRYLS